LHLIRKCSEALFGPDAKQIISPISDELFVDHVKKLAIEWGPWVHKTKHSIGYQYHAILSLARAYYVIQSKRQGSKQVAGKWMCALFPHWRRLIHDALSYRENPDFLNCEGHNSYERKYKREMSYKTEINYNQTKQFVNEVIRFIRSGISAISFKSLAVEHLSLMYEWFQEPTVKKCYAQNRNFSLQDIKEKYSPRIDGKDKTPSYIIHIGEHAIGFIQYYCLMDHLPSGVIDQSNRLFELEKGEKLSGMDLFIADKEYRGNGLGQMIIEEFMEEFLNKKFNRIIVDPVLDNKAAIHCYEKSGFIKTDYSNDKNFLLMIAPCDLSIKTGEKNGYDKHH
jgi:ribosomal protein S18 acetylase RimI-like enzyme